MPALRAQRELDEPLGWGDTFKCTASKNERASGHRPETIVERVVSTPSVPRSRPQRSPCRAPESRDPPPGQRCDTVRDPRSTPRASTASRIAGVTRRSAGTTQRSARKPLARRSDRLAGANTATQKATTVTMFFCVVCSFFHCFFLSLSGRRGAGPAPAAGGRAGKGRGRRIAPARSPVLGSGSRSGYV
jgi:hypothetical protein